MDALVVGEALVDLVERDGIVEALPGGSAANAAVALARLGREVRLWTAYADDAPGRLLDAHLRAAGVTAADLPHRLARTPTAVATIGPTGAAAYRFDIAWDLGAPPPTDGARVIHVCSWGPILEPGAERVLELLAASPVPVSYDVNIRAAVTGDGPALTAAVERVASYARLVKASDEDLEVLYPGVPLADAAARLRALGAAAVVVTQGADGATWFGRGAVQVGAQPVAVADTIGAGDTFGAALLDALWDDPFWEEPDAIEPARIAAVLTHAVRAAAITVSRPGADPPYRSELDPGGVA